MVEKQLNNHEQITTIKTLLDAQKARKFRETYLAYHVYEQAQVFIELDRDERTRLYRYLTPEGVGDMFNAIEEEPEKVVAFFDEMTPTYAAGVINEMYSDNVVDILAYANKEHLNNYLRLLPAKTAAEIRKLLHYEDKTAGSIMSTEFVAISQELNVEQAMQEIKVAAKDAETIYYVYVINDEQRLVGILTLRDMLRNENHIMVKDIMNRQVMSVKVEDDQEDVARTIRDYNFLAIPVTDFANHMIGIINVDDIIDVIDEESAEDYSGLAAVDVEQPDESPWRAAFKRMPWLITLLLLGMSTTSLISHYESLVSQASILAVFMSSITGTAGNAGTQSLATAVRRLAFDDDEKSLLRQLFGELITGVILGLVTGTVIMIIVGIWKHNFVLGFVIGFAMMCAIIVANLAGSFIPMFMDKIGVDPAVASGPFISTLSDLTSVLIYFNIARLFLNFFVGQ